MVERPPNYGQPLGWKIPPPGDFQSHFPGKKRPPVTVDGNQNSSRNTSWGCFVYPRWGISEPSTVVNCNFDFVSATKIPQSWSGNYPSQWSHLGHFFFQVRMSLRRVRNLHIQISCPWAQRKRIHPRVVKPFSSLKKTKGFKSRARCGQAYWTKNMVVTPCNTRGVRKMSREGLSLWFLGTTRNHAIF